MSIEEWDLDLDNLTGRRRDAEGNLLAEVAPDPHELSDWGGPAFKWGTGSEQGHSKSLASGTARADRQLRIEGKLPYLETKNATAPACGHIDCIELMGCAVEAFKHHGGIEPNTSGREHYPGCDILLHRVSTIGRSSHDWIWETT